MNNITNYICTNETLIRGQCYGYPVCGFCYDIGVFHKSSQEYELFNLVCF